MAKVTFPTLSHDEIIAFLMESADGNNIPVTLASLKSPTQESTVAIFQFILGDIMGLNIEQVYNVPFQLLTATQYPDAFPELRFTRFYGLIQQIMESVHYADFRITDLTEPGAARLRKQLSALINFVLYMQKVEDDYGDGVVSKARLQREHLARLELESRDAKEAIHRHTAEGETLRADVQVAQEAQACASAAVSQRQQQKEQVQAHALRLKADVAARESQLQTLAVEQAEREKANKGLEMQVVGSPEKAKDKMSAAKMELEAAGDQAAAVLERRQELYHKRSETEQKENICKQLQNKISTVSELSAKQEETSAKISNVTSETTTLRQTLDENSRGVLQLKKRCEMIEESRESQLMKSSQYMAERQQELQTRNSTVQHVEVQSSEAKDHEQQLQKHQQQVEEQLQQLQMQHKTNMDAVNEQEKKIRQTVVKMKADFDSDLEKLGLTEEKKEILLRELRKRQG